MNTPASAVKILMVENGRGGYSQYARELCSALSAEGCRIAYLASRDHDVPIEDGSDVRLLLHPHSPARGPTGNYGFVARRVVTSLHNSVHIYRFARRYEPQVLHIQLATPLTDACTLPLLRKRWPVVLTAHDVIPHSGTGTLSRPAYLRRLYRGVDRIIVHSAANGDTIMNEFSIPASRIAVIPHGTNVDIPVVPMREARRQLELPQDEFLVLALGVIRSNKRLDRLIEACGILFSRQRGIRLVIAGRPQDLSADHVHGMLATHGIADRTTTRFGWIPDRELALYLNASDVCVLPYVNFYSQSGILMRALSLGTPSIVADGGSLAAVVTQDETGMVFPADDPHALASRLQSMLGSDALRTRFSRNAQWIARTRYDWRIVARTTLEMYRSLIDGPSEKPPRR